MSINIYQPLYGSTHHFRWGPRKYAELGAARQREMQARPIGLGSMAGLVGFTLW